MFTECIDGWIAWNIDNPSVEYRDPDLLTAIESALRGEEQSNG